MFKKGQGYILYLILFFISANIAATALYLQVRQQQVLNNLFIQIKCSRLAESGINYFEKINPELPPNYSKKTSKRQIKELTGFSYTFEQGTFKLVKNNQKIYCIGSYQDSNIIYQKDKELWEILND